MFASAGMKYDWKTNHSGKKIAIQSLLHAGLASTDTQQLSSHRNVQFLNAYSTLSSDQQALQHLVIVYPEVSVSCIFEQAATSTVSASAAMVSVTSDNTACNDDDYVLFSIYFVNDDKEEGMDMISFVRQQKKIFWLTG